MQTNHTNLKLYPVQESLTKIFSNLCPIMHKNPELYKGNLLIPFHHGLYLPEEANQYLISDNPTYAEVYQILNDEGYEEALLIPKSYIPNLYGLHSLAIIDKIQNHLDIGYIINDDEHADFIPDAVDIQQYLAYAIYLLGHTKSFNNAIYPVARAVQIYDETIQENNLVTEEYGTITDNCTILEPGTFFALNPYFNI